MYIAHISDLHIGDPSKPGEESLKRVSAKLTVSAFRLTACWLPETLCTVLRESIMPRLLPF